MRQVARETFPVREETMRPDRFTTLAQEALASAQTLAITRSHAELTPLHVLAALLADTAGITGSIMARAGIDASRIGEVARAELERLPTVSGGAGQPPTSPATVRVLTEAEKQALSLKDAYISTEHLLLQYAKGRYGRHSRSRRRIPTSSGHGCL